MTQFSLPRRFAIPSPEQVAGALNRANALFWFRDLKGDHDQARPMGKSAQGNLEMGQWAAGVLCNPPGYDQPRPRTRPELLRLAHAYEMFLHGQREQLLEADADIDPYMNEHYVAGALAMTEYLLGMREEYLGVDMHPEDVQAAREHWTAHMRSVQGQRTAA